MKISTMNTPTTTIPIMAPNGRPSDICPGIVAETVDEIDIVDIVDILADVSNKNKNLENTTTFT